MLETNYIATTSNMAFRRSLICDHGLRFRNLRYAHDWEFILSACHVGKIRLIPEPLVEYRVHASNTIKEGSDSGTGQMRFEIQWVVARHASRILKHSGRGHVSSDTLVSRAWNSMPTFGCDGVLDRLLVLRAVPKPRRRPSMPCSTKAIHFAAPRSQCWPRRIEAQSSTARSVESSCWRPRLSSSRRNASTPIKTRLLNQKAHNRCATSSRMKPNARPLRYPYRKSDSSSGSTASVAGRSKRAARSPRLFRDRRACPEARRSGAVGPRR